MDEYPTDFISLPSNGYFYAEGHPLSSGIIEVKYLTGKHEEILSNQNLILRNKSIETVLRDIIVDKSIIYDDILCMDKHAIIMGSRILSHGDKQHYNFDCPRCQSKENIELNLSDFETKPFPFDSYPRQQNLLYCELPNGDIIFYKFPTIGDEKKFLNKNKSDYLKNIIVAVNETDNKDDILRYINEEFSAKNSLFFRKFVKLNSPEIDNRYKFTCKSCEFSKSLEFPIDDLFIHKNLDNRANIHEEIFSLCYYGIGFTEADVYNMPIYKRKFYLKKLNDVKQKESEEMKSSNKSDNKSSMIDGKIQTPAHFKK